MYYSAQNEPEKAIERLKQFSGENNYFYWTVLFTPIEPVFDILKGYPEFNQINSVLETKFNKWHNEIESRLRDKGLI